MMMMTTHTLGPCMRPEGFYHNWCVCAPMMTMTTTATMMMITRLSSAEHGAEDTIEGNVHCVPPVALVLLESGERHCGGVDRCHKLHVLVPCGGELGPGRGHGVGCRGALLSEGGPELAHSDGKVLLLRVEEHLQVKDEGKFRSVKGARGVSPEAEEAPAPGESENVQCVVEVVQESVVAVVGQGSGRAAGRAREEAISRGSSGGKVRAMAALVPVERLIEVLRGVLGNDTRTEVLAHE
mmetsp:Transcript_27337/g.79713  ORF Transcript_27337/g.79713 Transcript_27337/m.79713 type:complete len:239 (+) Transcript_27337:200-916(+)